MNVWTRDYGSVAAGVEFGLKHGNSPVEFAAGGGAPPQSSRSVRNLQTIYAFHLCFYLQLFLPYYCASI